MKESTGISSAFPATVRLVFALLGCVAPGLFAQILDPEPGFEAANKLYEQGHYREAAAAYESLIQGGTISPGVYFNLGNAWFKAGQRGRAIAAYRSGLHLSPRDPSLRFNLRFVRQAVSGAEAPPGRWWERGLAGLTLNEWTVLFVCALWLWFLLLAAREIRTEWRRTLRGYTVSAGFAAFFLLVCLGLTLRQQKTVLPAVVITPEAVVRYGPLNDSQVYFQLRDGMELSVLDEKPGEENWFLVQDASGREGWLKGDEVMVLRSRPRPAL